MADSKIEENICIFIFRRDFRLDDNVAFIEACKYCRSTKASMLPIFIFTPSQIDPSQNGYYSCDSVQFMIECLEDLRKELIKLKGDLCYFHNGDSDALRTLVETLPKTSKVKAIYYNIDYTPYARKRDSELEEYCKGEAIECNGYNDYTLLSDMNLIKRTTTDGEDKPYSIFTPYYKKCLKTIYVEKSVKKSDGGKKSNKTISNIYNPRRYSLSKNITKVKFCSLDLKDDVDINDYIHHPSKNDAISVRGGKENANKILRNLKKFKHYTKTRDIPSIEGTTRMSAYLKYGCFSVRKAFYTILRNFKNIHHDLIKELFWREFYAYTTYHNPRILQGQLRDKSENEPMQEKYIGEVIWEDYRDDGSRKKKILEAWKNGKTGFPIVDAGMRQMNKTGWMHNRLRMITASFLVKDLLIDWKEGERYFAKTLVDYDPASNNGGWQWCASIGSDAQPYFRIFNPWLQSKTHDNECKYIKEWIPELREMDNKDIHNWWKVCKSDKYKDGVIEYVAPIVDHATQKDKIKAIFENINK